jgi:hypothetical protein
MPRKNYIVAVRSDKQGQVSQRWQEDLQATPGVEVQECNPDGARIAVDESGIGTLRAKLGADFLIEEEYPRFYR